VHAPRPLLAVGLAALLAGSACASGDGSGGDGSLAGGTIRGHLAALPATAAAGTVLVTYGDLARAEEIAGLDRPTDLADREALADHVGAVTGTRFDEPPGEVAALLPEASSPAHLATDPQGFVDDVGWSILQVDTFVELPTPPHRVTVLTGDFDEAALDGALDDAGDGAWVAGDPEGTVDVAHRTPARPLGETLWLALDGDRLVVAADEDDVRAARAGDDSLADHPVLAPLAAALDEREVYSAMLWAPEGGVPDVVGRSLGPGAPDEQRQRLEELPRCEAMTGVAVGVAHDGAPLVVLATAHADEDAAEAGAEVLAEALASGTELITDRPWSDLLAVESVEADGTVVVALARPGDVSLQVWSRLLQSQSFPPC